jgi:hypothetical protein
MDNEKYKSKDLPLIPPPQIKTYPHFSNGTGASVHYKVKSWPPVFCFTFHAPSHVSFLPAKFSLTLSLSALLFKYLIYTTLELKAMFWYACVGIDGSGISTLLYAPLY